jgi:hypothetical protein
LVLAVRTGTGILRPLLRLWLRQLLRAHSVGLGVGLLLRSGVVGLMRFLDQQDMRRDH